MVKNSVYRKCLKYLEVNRPRRSKDSLETCLCVLVYLGMFTCSFLFKFMWEVPNISTSVFGLETSVHDSPGTNQSFLEEDPTCG